jgi:hypothetical protein
MADEENTTGPNKRLIMIIGAVGVGFMLYNMLDGSNDDTGAQTNGKPVAIERGTDPVNDIGVIDRDAALAQFNKKIQALQEKLEQSESRRLEDKKEFETIIRQQDQKNNNEFRALAETVSEMNKSDVNVAYDALNRADNGTDIQLPGEIPDSGLNLEDFNLGTTPMETEQPTLLSNPFGPNYFVLNPNRQGFSSKPSGGAELYATEDELFKNMSSPDGGTTSGSMQTTANTGQAQQATTQPVNQASNEQADLQTDDKGIQREKYVIPAFSYVEVTTLHGVACPVGANSPNQSGSSGSAGGSPSARPVVLPVRGIFRGPNGAERDLGTIHLMGLCSGNRTASSKTGRATVRVEQLSYWDEYGVPQHLPALGYIVDNRDNQQDVYGRLEKASGRTLALQSAAAAAAAYATTLSQAEFTNSTTLNLEGGTNTQSQLTGDAAKAAINQGIAAMFNTIAKRFEAEANSVVDTVIVEPGITLKFITEQPIEVFKPAEPFDIDAERYDVLI